MTNKEIGEILKKERKKKGWSQQVLAKKVGITWEMVSRYERGVSSPLNKLFILADVLSIDLSTLLGNKRDLGNFADGSAEYLATRFIPVLSVIPATNPELITLLQTTEAGMRLFDDGQQIEKFGVRLGPDSKIRITAGNLLPRGTIVCTLALNNLTEKSLVLVARKGLVSVEQYVPGDTRAVVLARILEWVVKFEE